MAAGEFIGWIRDGGVIGVLAIIVWGAYREWWVSGATFRRTLAERDALQRDLFDVLRLADRATRVAETSVSRRSSTRGTRAEAERDIRERGGRDSDDDR
jgi:hypothetical protein